MSLEFVSPKVGTIREISGEKFWIWKIGKRPIRNLFRVEIFWALDSGMRFLAYDRIVDEFFLRINKFII